MNRREQIIHAVRILSKNPDDQVSYLASIGFPLAEMSIDNVRDHNVDELLLQFDDAFSAVESMRQNYEISDNEYDELAKLNALIDEFDKSERDLILCMLFESEKFNFIRESAQRCLLFFAEGMG